MREANRPEAQQEINEKNEQHMLKGIDAIAGLYEQAESRATRGQRAVERIGARLGRPTFLFAYTLVIVAWIGWNVAGSPGVGHTVDAPPFFWLQGGLSLVALITSTTVLITQNRQGRLADQRAHIDLQVNLIAERKIAKLIELIEELRRDIPSVRNRYDADAEAMQHPADPHLVANALKDRVG